MDKVILIMTLCLIGQARLVPLSAENQLKNEGPPVINSDGPADIGVKDDKTTTPSPDQAQEGGNQGGTQNEVQQENEPVLQPPQLNTRDRFDNQEQKETQDQQKPVDMTNENQEDPQAKEPVRVDERPQEDIQRDQMAERHEEQDGQQGDSQYLVPEKGEPIDTHEPREEEPLEAAQGIPVEQGDVEQNADPLLMRPTAEYEEKNDIKDDRQDQKEHVHDRQDDGDQAAAHGDGNRYDTQDEHPSSEEVKPAQADNQEPDIQEDQKYLGERVIEPDIEGRDEYMQQTEPKNTEPTPPVHHQEEEYQYQEESREYQEDSKTHQEDNRQHQEDNMQYQEDNTQYQDDSNTHQEDNKQHQEDNTQYQEDNTQYQDDSNTHQEDNKQHQEDNTQYQDSNIHQEDNRQHQEDNTQYQDDSYVHREDNRQYQASDSQNQENTQHQEHRTRGQYQEDDRQYQEENRQYHEDDNQYQEYSTQHQDDNRHQDGDAQYQKESAQYQEDNTQYQQQEPEHQVDNTQEYHTESSQGQDDFKAEESNQYQEVSEQLAENVQYHGEDSQQQHQQQEPEEEYKPLPELHEPQQQEVEAQAAATEHIEQQEPVVQHVDKDKPLPANPNIVIFLADGISKADFVDGGSLVPNLMRIADEGVYFSNHMAGGVTDTSSRAAFMTGRLAVRYGMALDGEPDVISTLASQSGLPPTETTFASVLKDKGYSTALIGKWNLGMSCQSLGDLCHHPNNHGFGHYFGMPLVNHYTYANNIPKEELMQKPLIITAVAIFMAVVLRKLIGTLAIFIMAVSVLGVFGWTWFCINNPHIWSNAVMRNSAVVEQPAYMDRMGERMVKESVRFLKTARADNKPFLLVVSWMNSKENDGMAKLEELDQAVGELLKAVHELGLDSNTLTFFTSTPNTPGDNKDDTIRHTIRGVSPPMVPAILRWPSVVPSGLVVSAYTSHFDIMPTLVQASGGKLEAGQIYDGRSLFPRLRGELDVPTPLFVYCGAAPHVIMRTSSDGKVYAAHLFPPKWSYDAATPYCKPQLATISARERSEQEEILNIYELTTDTDNTNMHIPQSNPAHQQLLRTFTTLLEQHRYELEQPVDNQFTWYKQSWHAYLQPKCASTNEFTCIDSDNPLHDTDF